MFNQHPDGKTFSPYYKVEGQKIVDELPPDFYFFRWKNLGMFGRVPEFKKVEDLPEIKEVKSEKFKAIESTILNFFSEENINLYKELKIRNCLAALLYGPPGTGKTCLAISIAQKLLQRNNAVAVKLTTGNIDDISNIVALARGDNNDRLIIFLCDEFETFVTYNGQPYDNYKNKFIEVLDGYYTKDNTLFLMTTNFKDQIPDSLQKRPSRIKIIEEIKFIDVDVATDLVKSIIPEKYHEKIGVSELAYLIGENPIKIDQIKHVALDVLSGGSTVSTAVEKMVKMNEEEATKKEESE